MEFAPFPIALFFYGFAEVLRTDDSVLVGLAVGRGAGIIAASLTDLWYRQQGRNHGYLTKGPPSLRRDVILIVLGAIPILVWVVFPAFTLYRFDIHRGEYLAAIARSVPPIQPGAAFIRGKVVPLDLDGNRIDPMLFDLPERLRPNSNGEVGTLVTISCNKEYIGQ